LALCQTDSIELEIKNYPDSKLQSIVKGRLLMCYYIDKDDFLKVGLIKDYVVNNLEDSVNTAFNVNEYWLLLYFNQEYTKLLGSISETGLKSESGRAYVNRWDLNTYNDELLDKLENKGVFSKDAILSSISASSLSSEEKQFLNLHLTYLLSVNNKEYTSQENLNALSDKFISEFPYSVYNPFIRKIIRYKEKISDFAFGYDFDLIFAILNGNLKQSINNTVGFGFSCDLMYRNFVMDFSIVIGGAKLKQNISKQPTIWSKDMNATVLIPQIMLGYTFFNKNSINITPTVGLSMLSLSPLYDDVQNNPGLEEMEFNSNLTWSPGISLNFLSKQLYPTYIYRKTTSMQFYIQLKYSYSSFVFDQNADNFNGSMHQISLTFGVLMRKIFRAY
jgi:hypothetical protein